MIVLNKSLKKEIKLTMKHLLLILALKFFLITCSTSCKTKKEDPALTRDSKCYNACEPIPGEYQIKLGPDYIFIYDGPRFVDSLSYNETGSLEKILINDNKLQSSPK